MLPCVPWSLGHPPSIRHHSDQTVTSSSNVSNPVFITSAYCVSRIQQARSSDAYLPRSATACTCTPQLGAFCRVVFSWLGEECNPELTQDANACIGSSSQQPAGLMGCWQLASTALFFLAVTAALVAGQAAAPICPLLDASGCCGSQCRVGLCAALYSFGKALVSGVGTCAAVLSAVGRLMWHLGGSGAWGLSQWSYCSMLTGLWQGDRTHAVQHWQGRCQWPVQLREREESSASGCAEPDGIRVC